MKDRPELTTALTSQTFKDFYYLKEELVTFCKKNGLQTTGGKGELADRIAHFLDTGEKKRKEGQRKTGTPPEYITLDTLIEEGFVCSERHRAFYLVHIGNSFSFTVLFQKWLKNNAGKTYKDSIQAYHQILLEKKTHKTTIDSQFEYNTYIRDFFADNKGKTLAEAIKCWSHKKKLPGHNHYEKADLEVLE